MLIALAMLAQTVTLDADPHKAAMRCVASERTMIDESDSRIRSASEVLYFLMLAARHAPGNEPIFYKIEPQKRAIDEVGPLPVEEARAWRAETAR